MQTVLLNHGSIRPTLTGEPLVHSGVQLMITEVPRLLTRSSYQAEKKIKFEKIESHHNNPRASRRMKGCHANSINDKGHRIQPYPNLTTTHSPAFLFFYQLVILQGFFYSTRCPTEAKTSVPDTNVRHMSFPLSFYSCLVCSCQVLMGQILYIKPKMLAFPQRVHTKCAHTTHTVRIPSQCTTQTIDQNGFSSQHTSNDI